MFRCALCGAVYPTPLLKRSCGCAGQLQLVGGTLPDRRWVAFGAGGAASTVARLDSGPLEGVQAVCACFPTGALLMATCHGGLFQLDKAGNCRRLRLSGLGSCLGLCEGPGGMLVLADTGRHVIRALCPGREWVLAGTEDQPGYGGDGGPGDSAMINSPVGVCMRGRKLCWAERANSVVRALDLRTGLIETLAGPSSGLVSPCRLASVPRHGAEGQPDLVVADSGANCVFRLNSDNRLTCVAGDGTQRTEVGLEDGQIATTTALSPEDVAVTAAGELVIALPKQHSIIRVGLDDGRLFSIVPPTIARPVPLSLCICPLTGDCIFIDQSLAGWAGSTTGSIPTHVSWQRSAHILGSISKQKVVVKTEIISPAERDQLHSEAMQMMHEGKLTPNGPGRQFKTLTEPKGLVRRLTARLASAFGLEELALSPTLVRTVSVINSSGEIQPHFDGYPNGSGLGHCGHLRANIVVSLDHPSQFPRIALDADQPPQPIRVQERDAWIFMASHSRHTCGPVQCARPRIVYGFGWVIPALLMPVELGTPNEAIRPTLEQFTQQLESNWA